MLRNVMRIIGGRFRSRALLAPAGQQTRPTSDRLRETLMNVLTNGAKNRVLKARVADLYAGTGAVGLEALSRGAQSATFVEKSAGAMTTLEANCKRMDLGAEATCVRASVSAWLRRAAAGIAEFDLVFLDPPWEMHEEYVQTMGLLGGEAAKLLAADAWVIAEHRSKTALAERFGVLRCWRVIHQGDAALSFYAPVREDVTEPAPDE
jgi:16S rRNA (guanine(966)-N(2))-methyltransferase RsmD